MSLASYLTALPRCSIVARCYVQLIVPLCLVERKIGNAATTYYQYRGVVRFLQMVCISALYGDVRWCFLWGYARVVLVAGLRGVGAGRGGCRCWWCGKCGGFAGGAGGAVMVMWCEGFCKCCAVVALRLVSPSIPRVRGV